MKKMILIIGIFVLVLNSSLQAQDNAAEKSTAEGYMTIWIPCNNEEASGTVYYDNTNTSNRNWQSKGTGILTAESGNQYEVKTMNNGLVRDKNGFMFYISFTLTIYFEGKRIGQSHFKRLMSDITGEFMQRYPVDNMTWYCD